MLQVHVDDHVQFLHVVIHVHLQHSAAEAADGSPMDVDPELEVDYSGELDAPSDSKSPAKSSHNAAVRNDKCCSS